jgi:putative PIN family toxin of toxin-antitoxin system
MAIKKIRVVLDTNWYISATINKKSRRTLYELITDNNLTIIFSADILKEYNQVISRNKFKTVITAPQVERFIHLVISSLENIEITSALRESRDSNHNFLLSLSFDSNADYLVTGDKDLLVLQKVASTQIVTLADVLAIISRKTQ